MNTNASGRILIACKNGHRLQAKAELAGKTVTCPKCKTSIEVPTPQIPMAVPIEPKNESSAARRKFDVTVVFGRPGAKFFVVKNQTGEWTTDQGEVHLSLRVIKTPTALFLLLGLMALLYLPVWFVTQENGVVESLAQTFRGVHPVRIALVISLFLFPIVGIFFLIFNGLSAMHTIVLSAANIRSASKKKMMITIDLDDVVPHLQLRHDKRILEGLREIGVEVPADS